MGWFFCITQIKYSYRSENVIYQCDSIYPVILYPLHLKIWSNVNGDFKYALNIYICISKSKQKLQIIYVFGSSYVFCPDNITGCLEIYFHLSWFSQHERLHGSKWQIHSSHAHARSLALCFQVQRVATYSSTTCRRSLETMNSCRCFCLLALSSPRRSSWTVQPTRASVSVSSLLRHAHRVSSSQHKTHCTRYLQAICTYSLVSSLCIHTFVV